MSINLVQMDDVLSAMAESLMEKVPKPFKPSLKFQDKKIIYKVGGKPPKEVFYRKTTTFLTKLPPPLPAKACSCQYLCEGDPAVVKCHSCSIYFPTNTALYCQNCFNARHPWYRVPHLYTSIENDESIDHTLKIAHRVAESIRYEQEGLELLKGLQHERINMDFLADDEKVDNQIKNYGRRTVALEEKITEIRKRLAYELHGGNQTRKSLVIDPQLLLTAQSSQHDAAQVESTQLQEELLEVPTITSEEQQQIDQDNHKRDTNENVGTLQFATAITPDLIQPPYDSPSHKQIQFSETTQPAITFKVSFSRAVEAAATIRRVFRGYIARRTVSHLLASRIVKVWSPELGRDYYYDRVSGESSWVLTKLLRQEHIDTLAYIEEEKTILRWVCKRNISRSIRIAQNTSDIVRVLQGFARCILARQRIINRANETYRRILDSSTGQFYYANIITGETKWEKNSVYLSHEPPVYVDPNNNSNSVNDVKNENLKNENLQSNRDVTIDNNYSTPQKQLRKQWDNTNHDDDSSDITPSILQYSSSKAKNNNHSGEFGSSSKYNSIKLGLSDRFKQQQLGSPLTRTLSSSKSAPTSLQKERIIEDNRRSPRLNRLKT